jgi:hypothetical protein
VAGQVVRSKGLSVPTGKLWIKASRIGLAGQEEEEDEKSREEENEGTREEENEDSRERNRSKAIGTAWNEARHGMYRGAEQGQDRQFGKV